MKISLLIFILLLFLNCHATENNNSNNTFLEPTNENLWIEYNKEYSVFKLWSPKVKKVKVNFYKSGNGGEIYKTLNLIRNKQGVWKIKVEGDLNGVYYTFQVFNNNKWLNETPGIYAKAVGVNGSRAMVLDFETTNPSGWNSDKGPQIKFPNEAVIYELQVRDMTIQEQSGVKHKGKFLGLIEANTRSADGIYTGLEHIKDLGITHVQLLPVFDHNSIDETKLDSPEYNWGYSPQNYNVPEGSFSTNPFKAEVRISEFKSMVKAFHDNNIGVILDVVFNHTGAFKNSNFNLEYPEYYYRHWEDGSLSDASYCGNETASEKLMMRKFMIESVLYWAKEYHIDGFRFDLMAIHDIETMNEIANRLKEFNPNIFVYGEGWSANDSPLPSKKMALKKHVKLMPKISAFSDDIRDGLKGSVFIEDSTGFVSGADNSAESIKFGIVGSIEHPQIDYSNIIYSDSSWANKPWQAISYSSCHDNQTLYDKLKVSIPEVSEQDIIKMDKLANAIVLTSQGTAFIHAGAEFLRTKFGKHNSFNLPDSINQIDWGLKKENMEVFNYYKNLIELRKSHPAFRMTSAEEVRNNLEFIKSNNRLISYKINNYANGDSWKNILVIYNANTKPINYKLKEHWQIAVIGDKFNFTEGKTIKTGINVPYISMMILYQK